jgi:hypothetical protein
MPFEEAVDHTSPGDEPKRAAYEGGSGEPCLPTMPFGEEYEEECSLR